MIDTKNWNDEEVPVTIKCSKCGKDADFLVTKNTGSKRTHFYSCPACEHLTEIDGKKPNK